MMWLPQGRHVRWLAVAALAFALGLPSRTISGQEPRPAPASSAQETFAARVAALSEPGGFFDTDNLISNERSYLHVVPQLRALAAQAAQGGAYLGVGPDQSFSYIAHLRPAIAFIVDIRRDNLLLHLLFKALFEQSRTRVEYLTLLTGRQTPEPIDGWSSKPLEAIVSYVDRAAPLSAEALAALRSRVTASIRRYGVPLSDADLATIDRFHRTFINAGVALQFNSTGRAPQFNYPTYRDLLVEVDLTGTPRSFVASEESFQFLKDLQKRDLVIPMVGDLSGSTALAALSAFLTRNNQKISAYYTSNVEYYLFRDGSFPRFMANLGRLPHQPGSVIIRSVFMGGQARPEPGYNSVSLTQPIQTLLDGYSKGQFRQYWELTSR